MCKQMTWVDCMRPNQEAEEGSGKPIQYSDYPIPATMTTLGHGGIIFQRHYYCHRSSRM